MSYPSEAPRTRGHLKRIGEAATSTSVEKQNSSNFPPKKISRYETKTDSAYEVKLEKRIDPVNAGAMMSEPAQGTKFCVSTITDAVALTLLDLPNDAIKLVLKHLQIKDKKSFKLVSKASERKVLSLDPEMRKWKIVSLEDDDFEFEHFLPTARGKHIDQDYFTKIELFVYTTGLRFNPFDYSLLMESVINQWKDNIVHLEIEVSGINFYLLDPELRMYSLKSLHIKDSDEELPAADIELRKEKAMIINAFLKKLDTSLDNLQIDESIDVLVKELQNDKESVCEATEVAALTDNVLDLPDDKLRLVQYHLRKEYNEKLECKSNQYRVLSFQHDMGQCRIVFDEKNYEDLKVSLSKANIKHMHVSENDVFPLLDLPDDELKLVLNYLNLKEKKNMKLVSKSSEYKVLSLDPEMRKWKIVFNQNNFEDLKVTLSKAKIKHTETFYFQSIEISLELFNTDYSFARVPLAETVIRQWRNNIVFLKIDIMTDHKRFPILHPDLNIPNLQSLQLAQESEGLIIFIKDMEYLAKIGSSFLDKYGANLEKLHITDLQIPKLPNFNNLKEFCGEYLPIESVPSMLKSLPESIKTLELRNILYFEDEFILDTAVQLKLKKLVVKDSTPNVIAAVLKATQGTLEEFELTKDDYQDYFETMVEDQINPILNLDDVHLSLIKFTAKNIEANMVATVLKSSYQTLKYLDIAYIFEEMPGPRFNLDSIPLQLKKLKVSRTPAPIVIKVIVASHTSLEHLDFHFIHDEHINYFANDDYMNRWYDMPFNIKKITTDFTSGKVINLPIMRSKHSLEHLEVKAGSMYGDELTDLNIEADTITAEQIVADVMPVFKASLMWSETSELSDSVAQWLEYLVPSMKKKIQYNYHLDD